MNISGMLKVESAKWNACKHFWFLFLLSTFYFLLSTFTVIFAANMDAVNHWAWNDATGWIDVASLTVTNGAMTGVATSGVGNIYFDAASYPGYPGSLPAGVTWTVAHDSAGNLSGFAWNDTIGWISFWGYNPGFISCTGGVGSSCYQVTINGTDGNFSGYAWNDVVGWISFWCGNNNASCSSPAIFYRSQTSWRAPLPTTASLDSSVFNAGISATFNFILWQGNLNGGTVQFQIASSNAPGGPWIFVGTDHTSATYYDAPVPGRAVLLDGADHSGKQYVRYRIFLTSAAGKSPRVNDVIINWSR